MYENVPPSPTDTLYQVRGYVHPPIEGDTEVVLATIQPNREHARARFIEHLGQLGRIVTEIECVREGVDD